MTLLFCSKYWGNYLRVETSQGQKLFYNAIKCSQNEHEIHEL